MDASHLRQVIDSEIKSEGSEGSIRTLKFRRNALAPISSLPTEIISAIFSLLHGPRASPPFTQGEGPDQRDRLAWLRVTHVCHQWREIALNQPLFWSYVDFNAVSSAGAAEMLARARMMPLYLEARIPIGRWGDTRFTTFQKELQERVSHVRHLIISAEASYLRETLQGLVSPAPTLEYLSLYQREYPTSVFAPDTLFDGFTPSLTRLTLWGCDISWKSPLLRGLKNLEIRTPPTRPSLSLWLDALDEMPQLESLVLVRAFPIAPRVPFDVERTVTLPSLTHLNLFARVGDCALALAHLVLPALTALHISARSQHRSGGDVQELLPHFARHAHGPQDTRPLQSALIRGQRPCASLLAWPAPDIDVEVLDQIPLTFLPGPETLSAESARVTLFVMNGRWLTDVGPITTLDSVMKALPLDNLVTLTERHQARLDKRFWLRHAPRWPLLRHMRLAQPAAQGFAKMLLLEDNRDGCSNPLLPSLRKLDLVKSRLNTRGVLRLCDALMKRVEQGFPLEALDLSTCSASSGAVRLLSEIVVDVWGPTKTVGTDHDDDNDRDKDDPHTSDGQ